MQMPTVKVVELPTQPREHLWTRSPSGHTMSRRPRLYEGHGSVAVQRVMYPPTRTGFETGATLNGTIIVRTDEDRELN